jgi:hypothetical protein
VRSPSVLSIFICPRLLPGEHGADADDGHERVVSIR